ncbi:MAG: hypothetical protein Q8T08_25860, partial [Ignavibacteria bacterium]|nr:hypothetical protein [Ignavibacteria bacterium]
QRKHVYLFVLLISGFGVLIAQFDPNYNIIRYNPFGGFDVILINGGSSKITLLNMLIMLNIATVTLLWLNQYSFRKLSNN